MAQTLFATALALVALGAVQSLPTLSAPDAYRRAIFFSEQRANRVAYIGWPAVGCTSDQDCKGINGSYCMNDKTKSAPFFCHEPEIVLVDGLDKPVGLAVDNINHEVYYTEDDQAGGDTYHPLSAVKVDGTGKRQVLPKLLDPQGVDVDGKNGKVYYTEHHGLRVGVVDTDGSNQKVLHQFATSDDAKYPSDVKVDSTNGKVFALLETELSTGHALVSMNLDGSNMTTILGGIVRSYGITLDMKNKVVYYISGGHGGFVGNVSYDGKGSGVVLGGLDWPYMLDYDAQRELLVFSASTGVGDGRILEMGTDGKNISATLTLAFSPMGVAFGQVPYSA